MGILAGASLAPRAARADAPDPEAERLVKEGEDLLERGQIGEACDKFDLSLKRADNVSTLALLAFCHEREGKPGRAWNEFKRVEPRAPAGEKAAFVAQHLRALETKVARARLDVGSRTIGEVRVDNEVVLLDQGRVVADAGEHTIRVDTGGRVLTRNASLKVGDNPTIVMVEPTARAPAPPDAAASPPRESSSDGSGSRTAGWALAGAGVVLLGVGIVEGVNTLSIKSDADGICSGTLPNCSSVTTRDLAVARKHEAIVPSWIATVGIGLGVVSAAVGVYLLATSGSGGTRPQPPAAGVRVAPSLGLGSAGMTGVF